MNQDIEENAFAPGLVRHGSEADYAAVIRDSRESENARSKQAIEDAAPVVDEVQAILSTEFPLHRLYSESGIRPDELECLIRRELPRSENYIDVPWDHRKMTAAVNKLAGWLNETDAPRGRQQHASTGIFDGIRNLCLLGTKSKRLTVITGGVGVGKTTAADSAVCEAPRRYDAPGLARIEVGTDWRSKNQLLIAIYFALSHRPRRPMGDEVKDEVCRLLRPGDVVILDECQRLADCANGDGFEVVRELFDRGRASFTLIGNPTLVSGVKLFGGNYAPLVSRAGLNVHTDKFNAVSAEDVDNYMVFKGLSGASLRNRLVRWATQGHGGLRNLAQLCDAVSELHPGEPLTSEAAMKLLDCRGL